MAQTTHTVFVSSTSEDLADFRDAVDEHITRTGIFVCTHQKTMGGRHAQTVASCIEHAASADFYIGLIGMRRGWEPDTDAQHRSITEIEYDNAKPDARFVYMTTERFPVPGNLRETDDEHRRQLEFRQRVKTRIVAQPDFSSPERLAAQIVRELLVHVQRRPHEADPLANLPDAVAERILRLLDERGELKKAQQGGLERDIVLKLAKRIKPDDALDFDRAVAELENAITIALDVIARGNRGSNEEDFINDVLKTVGALTQAGENERAVKALDDALKELDIRETEHRAILKRSRLTLLQAGIEQDILRRDAIGVARRAERIAALEYPNDLSGRFATLRSKRDVYYVEGLDKGINFSLEIAIEISRRSVAHAREMDERGTILNDLGNALSALGERESSSTRLEEAVDTYRRALNELTRERAPLDWALTQNNLGEALRNLGARQTGTTRLDEAVLAYREALKEWTRERSPHQWAGAQNNLGSALAMLGERERGTTRLNEAANAFREALKESTRERAPLDWAMTQNNLGNTLLVLSARENVTARFDEAIIAYREALKEWTRELLPLQWATVQNNLGAALMTLAQHESGTAHLVDAIAAHREALKEFTRDRVPLDWGSAQTNLANALYLLGERERSASRLDEAVSAYQEALKEWTPERVPLDWAMSSGNQGVALMRLADWRGDVASAATAVNQIEQALAVMREGGHVPNARYYEAQLTEARAIRDRLSKA